MINSVVREGKKKELGCCFYVRNTGVRVSESERNCFKECSLHNRKLSAIDMKKSQVKVLKHGVRILHSIL